MEQFELAHLPVGHAVPEKGQRLPALMSRYRTGGTPWTIIIDREGVVRFNDFRLTSSHAIELIDGLTRSVE